MKASKIISSKNLKRDESKLLIMDNDKTIIGLLGVIIIMLLIGILILSPIFSKEDCRLEVVSMGLPKCWG